MAVKPSVMYNNDMTKENLSKLISLEIKDDEIFFNGVQKSAEWLHDIAVAKTFRTATIIKNQRNRADGGSMKDILRTAVSLGIIDVPTAWEIDSTNDKARVAEVKAKLPEVEKDTEPSDDDIKIALARVMASGGQEDF